jgi:hypothetical protein
MIFINTNQTLGHIFMTDKESEKVLSIAKQKNQKSFKRCGHKISGIFFVDDSTWTVWIDNVPYSSIGQKEEFSIDEVSEEKVVLTTNDGFTLDIYVDANVDNPDPVDTSDKDTEHVD